MDIHPYSRNYQTPSSPPPAAFPSLHFYSCLAGLLQRAGKKANAGLYTAEDWAASSDAVGKILEEIGASIDIQGFQHVHDLAGPCVFVSNHMSTLETFLLPGMIQPVRDVTFVIKNSLLKYPWLGPVLRSRKPLIVGRVNPREDLAAVLEGGQKLLSAGTSIIIFPQGTRSHTVDEAKFSSLGVKLGRKAGVPVMPVALKTDAWGTGALIKDLGWIRPQIPIHFLFGEPLDITGNGKEQHAAMVHFIKQTFDGWVHELPTA